MSQRQFLSNHGNYITKTGFKKKQHSRSLEISGKKPPVSCKTSLEPNRKLISIVVCAFSVIRQLYGRSSTPINEYLCIVMFLSSGSNLKYACCKSLCSWLLYTMAAYIYNIYIPVSGLKIIYPNQSKYVTSSHQFSNKSGLDMAGSFSYISIVISDVILTASSPVSPFGSVTLGMSIATWMFMARQIIYEIQIFRQAILIMSTISIILIIPRYLLVVSHQYYPGVN
jgi:hypothetical protein